MVVQKAKILLQKVTARKKSLLAAQSTALLLGEINDIASQFEDLKVSQNGIFLFSTRTCVQGSKPKHCITLMLC